MVGTHQKDSLQCAGFPGDDAPRAVFPFIVVVLAGTGQVPRGVPKIWFLLGDDVIRFRMRHFGSTVDTFL